MKLKKPVSCYIERLYYLLLHRIFKFDLWHIKGTWHCRSYKSVVVKLVDSVSPRTVVEIGCGLGDIITHVNAVNRIGYDIDPGAINAAKFLRGSACTFRIGSTEDVQEQEIDVLVVINWIHELSPIQLEQFLEPLLPRVGYLLLESIDADTPGYPYYHDFEFLKCAANKLCSQRGGAGEPRSIHLFKVIKR